MRVNTGENSVDFVDGSTINISTFNNDSGFITSYTEIDDLENVLSRDNSTGAYDISISSGQSIKYNNSGFTATISESTLAGNIVLSLPAASGTLASLSDIAASVGAYLPLAGDTMTGDIVTADGVSIKALTGTAELNLRSTGVSNAYGLTTDNDTYGVGSAWLYGVQGNNAQMGYQIGASEAIGFTAMVWGTPIAGTAWSVLTGDNSINISNSGAGVRRAVFVGAQNSTIAATLINTVVASGLNIIATASNALYANELRLQAAANAFDGIFSIGTLTADRTFTMRMLQAQLLLSLT